MQCRRRQGADEGQQSRSGLGREVLHRPLLLNLCNPLTYDQRRACQDEEALDALAHGVVAGFSFTPSPEPHKNPNTSRGVPARMRKSSTPSRMEFSNSHRYCRTASAVPWNHFFCTGLWLAASTCTGGAHPRAIERVPSELDKRGYKMPINVVKLYQEVSWKISKLCKLRWTMQAAALSIGCVHCCHAKDRAV